VLDRFPEKLNGLILSLDEIEKIQFDENLIRFHTRSLGKTTFPIIKSIGEHVAKIRSINTLSPTLEDVFVRIN